MFKKYNHWFKKRKKKQFCWKQMKLTLCDRKCTSKDLQNQRHETIRNLCCVVAIILVFENVCWKPCHDVHLWPQVILYATLGCYILQLEVTNC